MWRQASLPIRVNLSSNLPRLSRRRVRPQMLPFFAELCRRAASARRAPRYQRSRKIDPLTLISQHASHTCSSSRARGTRDLAIQPAELLRRCASANELTSFVIAKESRFAGRLRQSTGAIDQLDRHVASLRDDNRENGSLPITQRPDVGPRSRNDYYKTVCQRLTTQV
jgi:hypothetical protein